MSKFRVLTITFLQKPQSGALSGIFVIERPQGTAFSPEDTLASMGIDWDNAGDMHRLVAEVKQHAVRSVETDTRGNALEIVWHDLEFVGMFNLLTALPTIFS